MSQFLRAIVLPGPVSRARGRAFAGAGPRGRRPGVAEACRPGVVAVVRPGGLHGAISTARDDRDGARAAGARQCATAWPGRSAGGGVAASLLSWRDRECADMICLDCVSGGQAAFTSKERVLWL